MSYPEEVVDALKTRGSPLETLPVLDLGDRIGSTDYIDFIDRNEVPTSTPIMQFRDVCCRVGLAIRLRSRDGDVDCVMSFFQRRPSETMWVRAGHSIPHYELVNKYTALHDPDHKGLPVFACSTCPSYLCGASGTTMCVDILLGRDLVLEVNDGTKPKKELKDESPIPHPEMKACDNLLKKEDAMIEMNKIVPGLLSRLLTAISYPTCNNLAEYHALIQKSTIEFTSKCDSFLQKGVESGQIVEMIQTFNECVKSCYKENKHLFKQTL